MTRLEEIRAKDAKDLTIEDINEYFNLLQDYKLDPIPYLMVMDLDTNEVTYYY